MNLPSLDEVRIEVYRSRPDQPWTYAMLDQRQRSLAEEIQEGAPGSLILSELSPVITLGRRASVQNLYYSEFDFLKKGITIYPTDRGGLETYHGPGQWVLFPVEKVNRITRDPRGVKQVVEKLLQIACDVSRIYCPDAQIEEGARLGVWSRQGKIASVGVHVLNGVVLHGLSVNGFRTETSFYGLRPCGLDVSVDFLLKGDSFSYNNEFEVLGQELCRAALKTLWNQNERVDELKESSY